MPGIVRAVKVGVDRGISIPEHVQCGVDGAGTSREISVLVQQAQQAFLFAGDVWRVAPRDAAGDLHLAPTELGKMGLPK